MKQQEQRGGDPVHFVSDWVTPGHDPHPFGEVWCLLEARHLGREDFGAFASSVAGRSRTTRVTNAYAAFAAVVAATPTAELAYLALALCGPCKAVRKLTGNWKPARQRLTGLCRRRNVSGTTV